VRIRDRTLQNYTAHAWLPDEKERVVVGSDQGELLLVEGGEVRVCRFQDMFSS
jgi:hypothetical protein